MSERALQQEFEKWQRERTHASRKAFDQMLSENSFVEFWGRLGKIGGEGVDGGVKADEDDAESEGLGTKVDMKVLAKNVDVEEMEKVLRVSPVNSYKNSRLNLLFRTTSVTSYSIILRNSGSSGLEYVCLPLHNSVQY